MALEDIFSEEEQEQIVETVAAVEPDAVPEGWDIERDLQMEQLTTGGGLSAKELDERQDLADLNYNPASSTGMTFEQFTDEWEAADVGRPPTQEEYENWTVWGKQGGVFAAFRSGSTASKNQNVNDLLETGGYERIDAFEGVEADFFSAEDLAYLDDNDIAFDLAAADGAYVIVPEGTDMAFDKEAADLEGLFGLEGQTVNERYVEVLTVDGKTLYQKQEKKEWYEEKWVSAVLTIASVVAPNPLAGIFGSSLTGTIASRALFSGTLSGLQAETAGGDFSKAFTKGAITGGVSAGVSHYVQQLDSLTKAQSIKFATAAGLELAFDGDVEDALIAGAADALTLTEDNGKITSIEPANKALLKVGESLLKTGGDTDAALKAGTLSLAGSGFSKS